MKKILSVLLCVAALWMALPAQSQVRVGLKGGLNVSTVTFSEDIFDGDNRIGFFIGPMAEFSIPLLGLGVDVAALYSQTDARASVSYEGETASTSNTLKSVEIPVNLKWNFGLGSTAGVYVAAGPQFGFNIGSGHFAEAFDMETCYTTFNVGAGVKLFRHVQVGLNYNFGISKMAKTVSEDYEGPEINMKKNTWQVSLAYMF